jgi:hypothetical protein
MGSNLQNPQKWLSPVENAFPNRNRRTGCAPATLKPERSTNNEPAATTTQRTDAQQVSLAEAGSRAR